MGTWKYAVRFASGGKTKDGVPFFPWDADTWGWVQFDTDAIRLTGKRRMGVAGELLTLGPWQTLLKNAVADDLAVAIPIADIERVDVNRKPRNKITGFQVRQCLEDRSIVVHAFTTGLIVKKKQAGSDEAIAEMFEVVPREIVTGVAPPVPADWYPDPSGTHQLRYWDGTRWTPQVADNGQQSVDPLGK
jgi:hypothetical protein